MNHVKRLLRGQVWRVLRSHEAEFIVPDQTIAVVVPVHPRLYLFTGEADKVASTEDVEQLNRLLVSSSKEYIFARDFGRCPGVP